MRGHAIGHRAHHVFAYTAVHVGAAAVAGGEGLEGALVRRGRFKIGAAHHAFRDHFGQQLIERGRDQDAALRLRRLVRGTLELQQHILPPIGQVTPQDTFEFGALRGRQGLQALMPGGMFIAIALAEVAPRRKDVLRDLEWRMRPLQQIACGLCILRMEPCAVAAALALHTRDATADDGAAGDHRGTVRGTCSVECARDRLDVMPVHLHHMPAGHAETLGHVLADGDFGGAVIGDLVVVP